MKIEFHGDSTQAGASVWGGVSVQEEWTPAKVAGAYLRLPVKNYGIGGSTLAQAATGAAIYSCGSFAQHIAKSDAGVIVCNWGINDAYLPGNTAAQHRARWVTIKNIVGNKNLVIQTPNPMSVAHKDILANLVQGSRGIPGVHYIDIHAKILAVYPQWQHHLSDGIHPNGIMYQFIGWQLAEGLKSLI